MSDDKQLMPSRRVVLLTGATGFLGHHVAAQLAAAGHEVRALCRNPDSEAARRLPESVQRLQGDILDADAVGSAALGCDTLVHCAGMVSRSADDAEAMNQANLRGTEVTLEAARKAGIKRVVYASTSGTIAVGEDPDAIYDETAETPLDYILKWPYYRSKLYGEQIALDLNGEGFEVVVVNPSLLLGPGDLHGSSTVDIRRYLEQPSPVVPSGGLSFVDARDAAAGMILALERGRAGERYLLNGSNCTIRTFLSRVARVAQLREPVAALPDRPFVRKASAWLLRQANELLGEDDSRPDAESFEIAQHYWYCDASKAERELGWSSRDPVETIADTVEDLRQRGIVMMSPPT